MVAAALGALWPDGSADNKFSTDAHGALGFTEVGLVRCFRKNLQARSGGQRVMSRSTA